MFNYNVNFQLDNNGRHYVVDVYKDEGSVGHFINHSRLHFNARPVVQKVNRKVAVLFSTTREVDAGEELLFNHGPHYTANTQD